MAVAARKASRSRGPGIVWLELSEGKHEHTKRNRSEAIDVDPPRQDGNRHETRESTAARNSRPDRMGARKFVVHRRPNATNVGDTTLAGHEREFPIHGGPERVRLGRGGGHSAGLWRTGAKCAVPSGLSRAICRQLCHHELYRKRRLLQRVLRWIGLEFRVGIPARALAGPESDRCHRDSLVEPRRFVATERGLPGTHPALRAFDGDGGATALSAVRHHQSGHHGVGLDDCGEPSQRCFYFSAPLEHGDRSNNDREREPSSSDSPVREHMTRPD